MTAGGEAEALYVPKPPGSRTVARLVESGVRRLGRVAELGKHAGCRAPAVQTCVSPSLAPGGERRPRGRISGKARVRSESYPKPHPNALGRLRANPGQSRRGRQISWRQIERRNGLVLALAFPVARARGRSGYKPVAGGKLSQAVARLARVSGIHISSRSWTRKYV